MNLIYENLNQVRGKLEYVIREMSEEKQQVMMRKFEELGVDPFTHLSKTSINIHHDIFSFKKTNLSEYLELIKKH